MGEEVSVMKVPPKCAVMSIATSAAASTSAAAAAAVAIADSPTLMLLHKSHDSKTFSSSQPPHNK